MPSLERLKLDLKRVNKRKADLERQIAELEFDEMVKRLNVLGLSLDKIYTLDKYYIEWYYHISNIHLPDSYLDFEYHIDKMANEHEVWLKTIDESIYVLAPVNLLLEVNENE